ncbi:MAG TPA: response regulator [Verrucomicrobiota bacterium]|nr:response regulator [Verrucomicrobiota bacterium]
MSDRKKILILDDEEDLLAIYKDLLTNLPSKPEIYTTTNGARAVAMLDTEQFSLLITDLHMPEIDGFQVLAIVRKRFPELKILVISSILEEQYRARAYSLGVDMCWQKPSTENEIKMFFDCIESLLEERPSQGFRGIQNKSLVDLIQLECICRNSTTLKVISSGIDGKIFILNGEIIDAEFGNLTGDIAFKKLISLKKGSFEYLPAIPERERKIFSSTDGLLLDAAQTIDETNADDKSEVPDASETGDRTALVKPIIAMSKIDGVDFILIGELNSPQPLDSWGVDTPENLHKWITDTIKLWNSFGDEFLCGELKDIFLRGHHCKVVLKTKENKFLCVGFKATVNNETIPNLVKDVIALWV